MSETAGERASGFQTVARVGEVEEGQGIPCELNGRVIALFLDGGRYFAMDDSCPHKGAPLCDGVVTEGTVSCSWHGWCFGLADGRWVDNPKTRVTTYPVRVVGDEIQVDLG